MGGDGLTGRGSGSLEGLAPFRGNALTIRELLADGLLGHAYNVGDGLLCAQHLDSTFESFNSTDHDLRLQDFLSSVYRKTGDAIRVGFR
jgi:hypothetical protein